MFQHLLVPALNGNQSEVQGKKGEKRKLGKQRDPHPRSGDQEQKGVRKMNSTTVQLHIVLYLRGIPQYSCIVMCLRGIPQYSCIVWYLRGLPQYSCIVLCLRGIPQYSCIVLYPVLCT